MRGLKNYVVIQKDRTRYTFEDYGGDQCFIVTEQLLQSGIGSSMTRNHVTRKNGNDHYKRCMENGFHRFSDPKEVKW